MAYPTDTGQTYTTINGTDNTGATLGDGLTHSGRHNAVENEVTALKEKVGIDGDSDNSTLDFKTSEITGGDTAVGKSATQTLTNKTLTSPTISLWDGWDERTVGDYSYNSTTTISTSSDKTGEIQPGDKIKIVTAGGTFYFFATAVTSSAITVYGGTDYDVPNATFTQFAISRVKAPFGWPESGFIPSFFAFLNSSQSITGSTFTKVQFASEAHDEAGNYDNTTNYRFTAPISGKYQFNTCCRINDIGSSETAILSMYKNGAEHIRKEDGSVSATNDVTPTLSSVLSLAKDDYIEVYIRHSASTSKSLQTQSGGVRFCFFSGHLLNSSVIP